MCEFGERKRRGNEDKIHKFVFKIVYFLENTDFLYFEKVQKMPRDFYKLLPPGRLFRGVG